MNIVSIQTRSMKLPGSLLLFLLGLFPVLPAFGQEIEPEFREEAAVKWLELRKNTFHSSGISVETSLKESNRNPESLEVQSRIITTRFKQFTQGDFKYYESIPLTDTNPGVDVPFNRRHILVHNPQQTFSISKDPEAEWVLIDVEESPDRYVFVEDSIRANWLVGQKKGPLTALTQALGQDPRLMTDRTSAVERLVSGYLQYDEGSFRNFDVSDDEAFGRIVIAEFSCKVDLTERPRRRPSSAVKLTIDGEFKFLADWSWLPVSIQITHREFDKDSNELRKTTKTVKAVYDPMQIEDARKLGTNLIPQSVTITSKIEPDQRSTEIVHTIRSLTAHEIETIQKTKTLADFDLKDKK